MSSSSSELSIVGSATEKLLLCNSDLNTNGEFLLSSDLRKNTPLIRLLGWKCSGCCWPGPFRFIQDCWISTWSVNPHTSSRYSATDFTQNFLRSLNSLLSKI